MKTRQYLQLIQPLACGLCGRAVSSVHRFIGSSVHRFIGSSVHRFIGSSGRHCALAHTAALTGYIILTA
ncbi:hypothetical protein GTA61_20485 [Roseobacter sp. HKCCD8831]|uniref:hypothetical protein n=1 Tax=unclassified Roseobacter TaxID=196798 RepID=UPI001491E42A|nr:MULTISPECIES: hypothetical protein [unclassified Roseobacter]NNX96302.1 hypothetical protein [Roseobacter sp. HKCCD9042]NNY43193.1 hypothetical protein [Roseobacter sp. HKCCD8831]NNY85856.1 hypothetical protein [Roseobacter sp. HKCCD8088]NOB07095.1 hypothetical protein [Roseobacter sp. HKCCD8721]